MLKRLFFAFIIKPFVLLISGSSFRNKENIPQKEQFIIVANHNSHLDILSIMSAFSLDEISNISPVAADDYFFNTKTKAWLATNLMDIIPVNRKASRKDGAHPLDEVYNALDNGKNLIIFPEGSRGNAEELQKFKNGIGHIAKKYPDLKIVPIVLANAGRVLPRNESLLVPFIIKMEVKNPLTFNSSNLDIKGFVEKIERYYIGESS